MFPQIIIIVIFGIIFISLALYASLEVMCYILIFTLPIDPYIVNVPGIPFGISIFRVLLFLIGIIYLTRLIFQRSKIYKNPCYIFLFLYILGLLISLLRADFSDRTLTIIRISIAGVGIMFLFSNILTTWSRINKAIYSLIATSVFYIFFTVHTYFQGFFGSFMQEFSVSDILPFDIQHSPYLARGSVFVSEVGRFERLSLPTGSPPRLSIFLSINAILILALFLYYFLKNDENRNIKLATLGMLLAVASAMVFLTLARTGALSYLMGIIFLVYFLRKKLNIRKVFILLSFLLIVSLIFIIAIDQVQVIIYRLTSSVTLLEHWVTRMDAISLWTQNIFNFLFGIGLSDYELFFGAHSHSAYTTVLAERGFVGFVLFWSIFFYIFIYFYRLSQAKHPNEYIHVLIVGVTSGILIILFGSLLYEFMHEFTIWVSFGLAGAIIGVVSRGDEQLLEA